MCFSLVLGNSAIKSGKPPKHIKYGDARDNAAIILQCSNVCPFKYFRNTFYCAYCRFSSPEFEPVRFHTQIHKDRPRALIKVGPSAVFKADITGLKCDLCDMDVSGLNTLFDHLVTAHERPLVKEHGPGIFPFMISNVFTCAHCGIVFDRFPQLNQHVNVHYPNYICSQCGKGFSSESRLKAHVVIHDKKQTQFKCSACDDVFPSPYSKRMHMYNKHNILAYKCSYCDMSFKDYSQRNAHMNDVHNKSYEYPCSVCTKVLATSWSRVLHMRRIHLRDKRHDCTVCSSSFITVHELTMHMLKHTDGEKNYKCEICHKAYARKYTLTEHMRIHNNDKRFVCQFCNTAFVQKGALKVHLKTYHPNDAMEQDVISEHSNAGVIQTETSLSDHSALEPLQLHPEVILADHPIDDQSQPEMTSTD